MKKICLNGKWRFAFDPRNTGVNLCGGWYGYTLPDEITLPGDVQTNGLGVPIKVQDAENTGARTGYSGAAWIQRDVEIPPDWAGKEIFLTLPRTARTALWLDDIALGRSDILQAPQVYALGAGAYPGRHTLTLRIDNGPHRPMQYCPRLFCGVFGEIALTARDPVYIERTSITPLPERCRARIEIWIVNRTGIPVSGTLCFRTGETQSRHILPDREIDFLAEGERKKVWFELYMGEDFLPWDEFNPHLYRMEIRLQGRNGLGAYEDESAETFGMRSFTRDGTRLCNNGKGIYLRGDLPGAMMRSMDPLLADDPETWRRKMREYREYGFNHLRFHTACPPEAVFRAADEYGMYLQVELGLFASLAGPGDEDFEPLIEPTLRRQGEAILRRFGNHPSFVMMTLGNEIEGDPEMLGRVVSYLRGLDPSRLYAQGSNNNLNDPFPIEGDDFFISNKARKGHLMMRGSCAHADYPVGMVQNEDPPDTARDLRESLAGYTVPVISHEVGQYESSADFSCLHPEDPDRSPRNLALFRERTGQMGLLPMWRKFLKASSRLSALCYREDLELGYRTEGFSGLQLLALNDCLGEGSSLVGLRNREGVNKGGITPEEWRMFCSDRVLLLRMGGYVYRSGEEFRADVLFANFGPDTVLGAETRISFLREGKELLRVTLPPTDAPQGTRTSLGEFRCALPRLESPAELAVEVAVDSIGVRNLYPIWIFPDIDIPQTDRVVHRMDDAAYARLAGGETLIFMPDRIPAGRSIEGHFASNFWSWGMFSRMSLERGVPVSPSTVGLYLDPGHPALEGFPTGDHSDWQWWRIIMHSRALIMNDWPKDLEPLVWVIDNAMRTWKLGMLAEIKVGPGNLLISSVNLIPLSGQYIEARTLLRSLIRYAESGKMQPSVSVPEEEMRRLLW